MALQGSVGPAGEMRCAVREYLKNVLQDNVNTCIVMADTDSVRKEAETILEVRIVTNIIKIFTLNF